MDNLKTGKLIAEARKNKGMTQMDLAEKMNISDRTVSKWERGKGFPDVSLILPLSEALDLSVTDILSGELTTDKVPEDKEREKIIFEKITGIVKEKRTRKKIIGGLIAILVLLIICSFTIPIYTPFNGFLIEMGLKSPAPLEDYPIEAQFNDTELFALINYYLLNETVVEEHFGNSILYGYHQNDATVLLTLWEDNGLPKVRYEYCDAERGIWYMLTKEHRKSDVFPDDFLLSAEDSGKFQSYDYFAYNKDHIVSYYKNFWVYQNSRRQGPTP